MLVNTFLHRNITSRVEALLDQFPVVVLRGSRGTGKTTLARRIADDRGGAVLSAERAASAGVGRGHGFTVIDDIFDATPGREVIDAVRAATENTRRPGTFLLTSSSDPHREGADATGLEGWTVAVPLLGLSRGEFLGRQDDLVTAVLEGALESTTSAPTPTGRQELLARGSHPGLGATDPTDPCDTAGWYRDYLTDLVTRDVPSLVDVDDPSRIRALLGALAENQAGELTIADLATQTDIPASTVSTYVDLLQNLLVLDVIPAWEPGVSSQEIQRPTAVLTDSGLAMTLGATDHGLLKGFVLAELGRQSTWTEHRFRIHTYRNGSGRAADAILELRDGRVIAIQVPGENGTPTEDAASDLEFLRDNLGERFIAGIIIGADGSGYRSLGERVWEVPLSVLWELNTLNTPNADPDGSPEE